MGKYAESMPFPIHTNVNEYFSGLPNPARIKPVPVPRTDYKPGMVSDAIDQPSVNVNNLLRLAPAAGALLQLSPTRGFTPMPRVSMPEAPETMRADYRPSERSYKTAINSVDQTGNNAGRNRALKAMLTGQKLEADNRIQLDTRRTNNNIRNNYRRERQRVREQNARIGAQESVIADQERAAAEQFSRDRNSNVFNILGQYGQDNQRLRILPEMLGALQHPAYRDLLNQ
jgi:hypothetical protein